MIDVIAVRRDWLKKGRRDTRKKNVDCVSRVTRRRFEKTIMFASVIYFVLLTCPLIYGRIHNLNIMVSKRKRRNEFLFNDRFRMTIVSRFY